LFSVYNLIKCVFAFFISDSTLTQTTKTYFCITFAQLHTFFTFYATSRCKNWWQWVFSSNVTLDMVTLTNFVKDFNFCGGLYFDSLVAKPLIELYYNSSCNFWQSNDLQKVQYETDLLGPMHSYLYRTKWRWLKWNGSEKRWLLKRGFNKMGLN
jgi:hypothetical protein